MEIKGEEKYLIIASMHIKNALIEIKKMPCKCTEDDYCERCMLIADTKNLKSCYEDTIRERL